MFASALLAIVLRTAADRVAHALRLPATLALCATCAAVLALLAGAFAWQGPRIADEAELLRRELPQAVESLRARAERVEGLRRLEDVFTSDSGPLRDRDALAARAGDAAASTFGALTALGLWLFLAFLLALSPQLYRDGLVALLPPAARGRAHDVLAHVRETLWWWSLGRMLSMTFVGSTTGVALGVLGVPLAFLLGLIAALLSFVPNVGPVIAAVPALLLALAEGPRTALWVVVIYVGVQAVENLVLDPVIDRRTVYLPPALTVVAQLVAGTLAGLPGVALAAPLTAVGMVVVSRVWIHGRLEARGGTA